MNMNLRNKDPQVGDEWQISTIAGLERKIFKISIITNDSKVIFEDGTTVQALVLRTSGAWRLKKRQQTTDDREQV